jgi:hypothetical protein
MTYEHTQAGWPVRIAFGVTALGFLVIASVRPFSGPTPSGALLLGALAAVAAGLMWSRLTVRIDGERLRWSFGLGWPRFSAPLAEITAVEVTRTTFWQGWGIRRTRDGWLYNISGWDAVLVTRRDGKRFLLGTDEPRRLRAALERAIAASRERMRG